MIDIKLDTSAFVASVKKLRKSSSEASKFSAMDIGLEIMRLSQAEVPHDKGWLQNSGNVEQVGDDVVVGYHTPYAARLHEHPEYRFQKGRKGKYLEDPIKRNAKALGISFGENMQTRIAS